MCGSTSTRLPGELSPWMLRNDMEEKDNNTDPSVYHLSPNESYLLMLIRLIYEYTRVHIVELELDQKTQFN